MWGVNQNTTQAWCTGTVGRISVTGDTFTSLQFQQTADCIIQMFGGAASGKTQELKIGGFREGDAFRELEIGVGIDADDTASFDGVSKYHFDGAISSATSIFSTTGPTDNVNVSGINTLFIDAISSAITIGGFAGGVDGQTLNIVKCCATANAVTLEHAEGGGSQDIFLHAGADETLIGEYGGWQLVCNGTSWFDASHAKHV